MNDIPFYIFDFKTYTYEVVSENYYNIFLQTKTCYYIRRSHYRYDYMPHLCRTNTLGPKYYYTFTNSGILFQTIYCDTQEEAIDVIKRAMRGEVEPPKRDENVVYSTSYD